MTLRKRLQTDFLPPLVSIISLVAIWQFAVTYLSLPAYLLPSPGEIGDRLYVGLIGGRLWGDILATMTAIAGGYLIGCPLGILAACVLSEFRLMEKAFFPLLVGLQSIPKVALAPIIIVWAGFGLESKVILVALMCFFPVFINTFAGLKSYNTDLADMFKVFGASKWRIFLRIKVPSSLTHVFAGLQISVVLAVLGTVLSEMIAAQRGLGYVIQSSTMTFDIPLMFACAVILAVIGVTLTRLLMLAQYAVVFWERGNSN